jgi:hydrogenase expression/formation protein HypC
MIHCTTCADAAMPGRVVALLPDGMATVEIGEAERQDVSVELVDARVGEVVLVHAGVAIGTLR